MSNITEGELVAYATSAEQRAAEDDERSVALEEGKILLENLEEQLEAHPAYILLTNTELAEVLKGTEGGSHAQIADRLAVIREEIGNAALSASRRSDVALEAAQDARSRPGHPGHDSAA